jgi:hypothetical protein
MNIPNLDEKGRTSEGPIWCFLVIFPQSWYDNQPQRPQYSSDEEVRRWIFSGILKKMGNMDSSYPYYVTM